MALVNPQAQHIYAWAQVVAFDSEQGAGIWRSNLSGL